MECKKVIWTCDTCEEEDPCILTYGYNQEVFPQLCPFESGRPNWKKHKDDGGEEYTKTVLNYMGEKHELSG